MVLGLWRRKGHPQMVDMILLIFAGLVCVAGSVILTRWAWEAHTQHPGRWETRGMIVCAAVSVLLTIFYWWLVFSGKA